MDIKIMTKNKKDKNNKNGFSSGEIVTVIVVISAIASIALPNYLRMRVSFNEEMVRRHMEIVEERMVEAANGKKHFFNFEEWLNERSNLTDDENNSSLTASLSATDRFCYTDNGYFVSRGKNAYVFCSKSKTGICGRFAGTRRFLCSS
jgi:hypothetical protein